MLDWHLKVLEERHRAEREELQTVIGQLAALADRDDLPAEVRLLAQRAQAVLRRMEDSPRFGEQRAIPKG